MFALVGTAHQAETHGTNPSLRSRARFVPCLPNQVRNCRSSASLSGHAARILSLESAAEPHFNAQDPVLIALADQRNFVAQIVLEMDDALLRACRVG